MKIGIIGLPQSGKKTLFKVLSGHAPSEHDLASNKPIKSMAQISDARLDRLEEIYTAQTKVQARLDIELLPKISEDAQANAQIFKDVVDLDAILLVIRAFENDAVYHIKGSVDAKRDIDLVFSELILHDLLFIEKRLERIEKSLKGKKEENLLKEKTILLKLKDQLDKELPLRLLDISENEAKVISSYPFITLKKIIVALNVSEDSLKDETLLNNLKQNYKPTGAYFMQVSAETEAEIASLDDAAERKEFLEAAGIIEPAINILTALCIEALNLISFFTAGTNEVRQWTTKKGSSAPEAAGEIHSDMQRGFIRAELIKFEDIDSLGSEKAVKDNGKMYLKGKDYIIEAGDILTIRFSV
jgi:hypothetical protein